MLTISSYHLSKRRVHALFAHPLILFTRLYYRLEKYRAAFTAPGMGKGQTGVRVASFLLFRMAEVGAKASEASCGNAVAFSIA